MRYAHVLHIQNTANILRAFAKSAKQDTRDESYT